MLHVPVRPNSLFLATAFLLGAIVQHFVARVGTDPPLPGCAAALHTCMELHSVAGIAGGKQLPREPEADSGDQAGVASTLRGSYDSSGGDTGYLSDPGANWWFNPQNKESFSIFDLDQLYPEFYHDHDHVAAPGQQAYVSAALAYCSALQGAPCGSVAEFGTASCFFTAEFLRRGVDTVGMDGARSALANCIKKGVPAHVIQRQDLRLPVALGRRFSMALCTEVAEHIEPPFSSQLISNLVRHADIVWFSFESAATNRNHIHHNNEQPAAFWANLFAFYGYAYVIVPEGVKSAAFGRAGFVFYNTRTIKLPPGALPGAVLDLSAAKV